MTSCSIDRALSSGSRLIATIAQIQKANCNDSRDRRNSRESKTTSSYSDLRLLQLILHAMQLCQRIDRGRKLALIPVALVRAQLLPLGSLARLN